MKFDNGEYFKHSNCLDTFIRVKSVTIDDGKKAFIHAYWMCQGIYGHWYVADVKRYFIKKENYEKWLPYTPIGNIL